MKMSPHRCDCFIKMFTVQNTETYPILQEEYEYYTKNKEGNECISEILDRFIQDYIDRPILLHLYADGMEEYYLIREELD